MANTQNTRFLTAVGSTFGPAGTAICIDAQKQNTWNGTSTPWTSQTTTPFRLAMNDDSGAPPWTPQAARPEEQYSGGAPFGDGAHLAYRTTPNMQQTLPLQIYADTYDHAVTLKQMLLQQLNTARIVAPGILAFQPDGASQAIYTEIYSAHIQETAAFINKEAGRGVLRCAVSLICAPFFSLLGAGESVFTATTFTNGTPQSFPTTKRGDLVLEGQPLNLALSFAAAVTQPVLHLASVYTGAGGTAGAGTYDVGPGATHTDTAVGSDVALVNARSREGITLRMVARVSAITANARLTLTLTDGARVVYQSPYPVAPLSTSDRFIDFGGIDMSLARLINGAGNVNLRVRVTITSADGALASFTLVDMGYWFYFEWCKLITAGGITTSEQLQISCFQELTARPTVPYPIASAVLYNTTTQYLTNKIEIRGTLPRMRTDASLLLAWNAATTATATVTATHAPLWRSLGGAT